MPHKIGITAIVAFEFRMAAMPPGMLQPTEQGWDQIMRKLAATGFRAVFAAILIAPPADAITLSCVFDRYDPNGTKFGSGVDHFTIDFDSHQWMPVSNIKILCHLNGFDLAFLPHTCEDFVEIFHY
jgi:hypothetical protein